MTKLEMLTEMIQKQRQLEAKAMKVMLHNPGILIQTTPVMWGGGDQPYQYAFNLHIAERGTYCGHFQYCPWGYGQGNFDDWFNAQFINEMGGGYVL